MCIGTTASFYEALGFDVRFEDGVVRIELGDFMLAFVDETQVKISKESGLRPKGLGVYTYIETIDVDEQYKRIKDNGLTPSSAPKNWSWGKREFAIKDPDGYKMIFYSTINP